MIEFAWPLMFLLLPLPLILYRYLPPSNLAKGDALLVPDYGDFSTFARTTGSSSSKMEKVLAALMWIGIVAASARPQLIGEPVEIPKTGRDLMLAVDLSGSMQLKDFEVKGQYTDRLTALKWIAGDFIDRRQGDRLGLILFGSQAYLQAPPTFDVATVKKFLMEAEVGLAGMETAIGDAIGLAVKQLKGSPEASRVLVLLTDGNNNAGELTPEKAASIAANAGLKVHTIAIGSKGMVVQTLFGPRQMGPAVEIDEKTLKAVAEKTGGNFYRAYNTQELAQIYDEIDRLEVIERSSTYYRPIIEYYYWPLLGALAAAALIVILKITKIRTTLIKV